MKTRELRDTALEIAVEARTRAHLLMKEPPKKSRLHLLHIHKSLVGLVKMISAHQKENAKKRKLRLSRKVKSKAQLPEKNTEILGNSRQNSEFAQVVDLDKLNSDLRIKRITNTLLAQKSMTSEKTIRRILANERVKQSTLDRFYLACEELGYKK